MAKNKTAKFITVEYCPLVCKNSTGFALELTKELSLLADQKIEINQASIQRAFQVITDKTSFHGMILGSKDHVPNSIFMKRPIYSQHVKFFSRKSLNWEYEGVESLKGKRLAVIRGFHYNDPELMAYIKNNPKIEKLFHSDSVPKLIKMLDLNRIDIFIAGVGVANYHLDKEKKKVQFKTGQRSLGKYENYISFSKNYKWGLELKTKYDKAFDVFRKTERYKDLLAKYSLTN